MADLGMKAMIPVGRPFLDYVLSGLADAGFSDSCLVVGPEHGAIRDYCAREHTRSRISIHFAIQAVPRGTADALLAAEEFVGGDDFVVMNADNYYPVEVLQALRDLGQPGTVLFEEAALIEGSNIPPERIKAFAYGVASKEGFLRELLEKPDDMTIAKLHGQALVSMNIWRFSTEIFDACREVPISPRGEYELPIAVWRAIQAGMKLKVVRCRAGVLDLSQRSDISLVIERLKKVRVSM
jgi:dTDP-glucose pyrophosphorylase